MCVICTITISASRRFRNIFGIMSYYERQKRDGCPSRNKYCVTPRKKFYVNNFYWRKFLCFILLIKL